MIHKDAQGNVASSVFYTYTDGTGPDAHNMLSATDPDGNLTNYTYDTSNSQSPALDGGTVPNTNLLPFFKVPGYDRVLSVTIPGGVSDSTPSVTNFGYNFANNTRVVSNPRGSDYPSTTYTLDAYGAATEIQAPEGQTTYMVWAFDHPDGTSVPMSDHQGRDVLLLSKTDALGRKTSYTYDALGNIISQTITSFAGGYAPVTQSDGTGSVTSVTASYTYDPLFDKLTSETDPNGVTIYFVYDSPQETVPPGVSVQINQEHPTGNLLASVDGMGFVTYYAYATESTYNGSYGPGDLKSIVDPMGNLTQYLSYDAYGDPTSIENANGDMITETYSARSLTLQKLSVGGVDVKNTYDVLGRLTSAVQADDSFNSPSESITYTYYPGGQVKTQISGLGQVTSYVYDSGNRLVTLTDLAVVQADGSQDDLTTQYVYDAAGNLVQERDPRGIITSYSYDGLNRLTDTIVMGGPAATPNMINVSHVVYDAVNNKLSETDLHGNVTTYTYDGLYRLVATTLPVAGKGGGPAVARHLLRPGGQCDHRDRRQREPLKDQLRQRLPHHVDRRPDGQRCHLYLR